MESIVGRLVLTVASYFLWQERNNRIHDKGNRSTEQVKNVIVDVVRLKLTSIKFKKNIRVEKMKETWKLDIGTTNGG